MENNYSIEVRNLTKIYKLYNNSRERLLDLIGMGGKVTKSNKYALDNVSFTVGKGETFGIIGSNGAGKSTLLKMITGVATPTSGSVRVDGKVSALLELGSGFNKNYTGIENIYLNGTMMGFTHEEMELRVNDIVEFADIGDYIYQPVKTYSSGMFARLAFSVAINIEPEILIVDEALSVGDVFFQNKCYKKFEELKLRGITVIFVSHDIGTIKRLCSRVLWMENGNSKMVGVASEVCLAYTNSILKKRTQNFKSSDSRAESDNDYLLELQEESYPTISYASNSIKNESVSIISAYISDGENNKVSECRIGEKYNISIVFDTNRDINNCIAGFVIETKKGLWVVNCNSLNSGERKAFAVNKNTRNKVDFEFTFPELVNGDYVVGVAISEGDLTNFNTLTWLYDVFYIQVSSSGENDAVLLIDADSKVFSREL